MSTSHDFGNLANTLDIENINEGNSYRYGRPDTYTDPDDESIRKPRSRRLFEPVLLDTKIETIKQRWNGVVSEINGNEITVILEDATTPSNPAEQVVLSLEEIEPRDRPLVRVGAMFVWHIGYRQGPKYPRERFSKITFRRLINWTQREIADAEELAKEYTDFLITNTNSSA